MAFTDSREGRPCNSTPIPDCRRPQTSFGDRLIDCRADLLSARLRPRAEGAREGAVLVDEVFVEVPFRRGGFAELLRDPFVERVRAGADDVLLRGHREVDRETRLAEGLDLV